MLTIRGVRRTTFGTKSSRKLRLNDKFPAIIYCSLQPNLSIELDQKTFFNMEATKVNFYKKSMTLIVDNIEQVVKIKEIQRHPFKSKILHIDFIRIT